MRLSSLYAVVVLYAVALHICDATATGPTASDHNPLMDTVLGEFRTLNARRNATVAGLGVSRAQWMARQAETTEHLAELFTPLERNLTPPTFNVTGSIHHASGFTMHKILYQTRPGLYVTGSLWVPDGLDSGDKPKKKAPAVLLVSGHTHDAWRCTGFALGDCTGTMDNCTGADHTHGGGGCAPHCRTSFPANPGGYQLVLWNLVHRGFVALAFDPIGQGERLEYLGQKSVDKGNAWGTFEHEYLARQLFLAGRSAASFWVHDEMRSIDLLAALPYVDANNLGVCGCSGGGTQSAYLASVDKRIKAASIACYMSTIETDYEYSYGGEYDGEQTWPRAAILNLDKPDLIEVRAPKPTQVLLTTQDNCFPYAGGLKAVNEAAAAFTAMGDADALDVHTAVYHHGWVRSNREAMYAFFEKHLMGDVSSPASSRSISSKEWWPDAYGNLSALFNASQLQVTSTGQVRSAPECAPNKIYHDFTQEIAGQQVAVLQKQRQASDGGATLLAQIAATAAAVSGYQAPDLSSYSHELASRATDIDDVATGARNTTTSWALAGEGNCTVTLKVSSSALTPAGGAASKTAKVIVIVERSTKTYNPQALLQRVAPVLTSAGYTVVSATLCGFGEHDAFPTSYKGMAAVPDIARNLNRSVVGYHAAELVRVSAWVKQRFGAFPFATVAGSELHSAALHAAVIAGRHTTGALALIGCTVSYEAIATSLLYLQNSEWMWIFNVLAHYDLPDLSAAVGGPQLIVAPVDAHGLPLNETVAERTFGFARKHVALTLAGVGSSTSVSVVSTALLPFLAGL